MVFMLVANFSLCTVGVLAMLLASADGVGISDEGWKRYVCVSLYLLRNDMCEFSLLFLLYNCPHFRVIFLFLQHLFTLSNLI